MNIFSVYTGSKYCRTKMWQKMGETKDNRETSKPYCESWISITESKIVSLVRREIHVLVIELWITQTIFLLPVLRLAPKINAKLTKVSASSHKILKIWKIPLLNETNGSILNTLQVMTAIIDRTKDSPDEHRQLLALKLTLHELRVEAEVANFEENTVAHSCHQQLYFENPVLALCSPSLKFGYIKINWLLQVIHMCW